MKPIFTTIACAMLACTASQADTFIVNHGESIQTILDQVVDGDIVELAAGSWQESLVIPTRSFTLRGTLDKNGFLVSSIDGGTDRAIVISDNLLNVAFEHLVVTGLHANNGGGAYIYRSNPSFTNCRFENCSTSGTSTYDGGGAVYIFGTSPTHTPSFDGCAFIGNSGNRGGAIGLRSTSGSYDYSASITNCLFQGNAASTGGAIGAIYSPDLGVDLEQCDFINNSATSNQGHALSSVSGLSTSLHSCNIVLDGAESDDLVSGSWEDLGHNCLSVTWSDADGDLRPDDCDQCDGPEYDLDGNGWSDCAQIDHKDGTFTFNVADRTQVQPALDFMYAGFVVDLAAGSYTTPPGGLDIPDVAFTLRGTVDELGQLASSINGGTDRAIVISDNLLDVTFEHLVITGLHANNGGGAYIYRSNPSFTNCCFENCSVAGNGAYDGGGAVYIFGTSPTHTPSFDGCAFIGNSGNRGGAIGLRSTSGSYDYSASITNCLFQGNAASTGGAIGAIYSPDLGVDLEQCDFINNSATSNQGHALSSVSGLSTSLHSCNIVLDGAESDDLVSGSWEDLGHNCLSVTWSDADGDLRPDDCDQCDGPEYDLDGNGWSDCAQIDHKDGTFTFNVADGTQIQPALDFVHAGFVVDLAAGSYTTPPGGLDIPDVAFTLRGTVDELGQLASSIDGGIDRAIVISDNLLNVAFEHLVVTGLHANNGGGAYIYRSDPSFTNCRFENCSTSGTSTYDGGGAVYIFGTSPTHTPSFDGCAFLGNTSDKGGAIAIRSASGSYYYSALFTDCLFQDNTASAGGAIGSLSSNRLGVDLDRCALINNESITDTGHAIHGVSGLSTSLHSCNIVLDGAESDDLVSGSWEDLGHNCLSVTWSDADGDLRPDDCDQCDGPEYDLDGNGWSDCAQIDHKDGTFTFNVADGTQIQPALDFVHAGFVVDLAAGSYTTPPGGLDIPDVAFTLRGTVDELGQLASSIDGGIDRAIVISDNLLDVAFERLVITGQHALYGGGAYIYRSNPSFTNCCFENCSVAGNGAYDGGGAVLIYGTSPTHVSTFDGCAFIGNTGNRGGAIGLRASSSIYEYSAVAVNCLFKDNTANYGGAICTFYTNDHGIDIDQCLFFNNTAAISGSAIAYTSGISTSIGNSAFCGLEPIINGSWVDLGGNCFTEICEDLDGDSIPDACDDEIDDECSADLDGDGVVDVFDLLRIISDWGTPDSDVTGDGMTDVLDLLAAINQWGQCPQ